mmetsp:Transcript_20456/g.35303  ORF Transcript_20456/g.35303 Transcript_20456/m.35303 type:complete len:119 (+) Transcript_20456:145-501(+)|eukprot:CAMPEP_0184693388 /NCGR_PEP_ID=MMETSP0313-20130426/1625_1 /TAXON_ID=2792 /ORGANISM="Porphyridium aerugineum, Strain SAG 1380-2" /LENGTH=118 /DNA_ID=CAMNT_0027151457 /DNA_START=60 /DNA_END=416 /DNA_ORIENTATION=-
MAYMSQTARWIKKFENDGVEVKEKEKIKSQADQYGRIVKDLDQRAQLAKQFEKKRPTVADVVQTIAVMRVVDTSDVAELQAILKEKRDEKVMLEKELGELIARIDRVIPILNDTLEKD